MVSTYASNKFRYRRSSLPKHKLMLSGTAKKVKVHKRIARQLNAESCLYVYKKDDNTFLGVVFRTPKRKIFFKAEAR